MIRIQMNFSSSLVLPVSLALLGACRAPDEPAFTSPVDTLGLEAQVQEPPPLVAETLYIEGMAEVIPVQTFRSPLGYPLGFSTVVPEDMVVEFVSSGEGDAVRIEAAFGGVRRSDVLLSFVTLPEGTDVADARQAAGEIARMNGGTEETDRARFPWADMVFRLGQETAGFIALGEHRDRWFYFLASYPPEFGDGMGPRIDLILRRWTWADDGTGLQGR
jgi:hypothetical protein